MEYIVEATKTIFGKEAYKVVNKKLESLDDWVYELSDKDARIIKPLKKDSTYNLSEILKFTWQDNFFAVR